MAISLETGAQHAVSGGPHVDRGRRSTGMYLPQFGVPLYLLARAAIIKYRKPSGSNNRNLSY